MSAQLTGTIHVDSYTAKNYFPGSIFHFSVHIPKCCENQENCALMIQHDGLNQEEACAMEQLAASKEAPCCITIGVSSEYTPAALDSGFNRGTRMNTYDMFGPDYPNFIVNELIPFLTEKYDLKISPSPDMHLASGGSSGGISAWNMAWYRTDYFHRVYMSSPSFLSMGKGREIPALIRKTETKPIRVFTEYSENEPDDYFGSSFCAADDAERALRFAGYDMMSCYYPGEGHCSRYRDFEAALIRFRFLWKDWQNTPVRVKQLSPRAEKLISAELPWETTIHPFPAKLPAVSSGKFSAAGTYTAASDKILFTVPDGTSKTVGEGFGNISALCISSDQWRLYIADQARGCVYAANIQPDGSLSKRYIHGTLHQETDFCYPGAYDICADSNDRICAVTESGIQSIRPFGLIDVIVSLPEGKLPEKIEFDTFETASGKETYLYALCGEVVYRRRWLMGERRDPNIVSAPVPVEYYD